MNISHQTPKDSVFGLIEAYKSLDIDLIVRNKDFELDSRLFWENIGLPTSQEQVQESIAAFGKNFRDQLSEGMPDYRSVEFRTESEEWLQDDFVIVTVVGKTPEQEEFELALPSFRRGGGWVVVMHPEYDHL